MAKNSITVASITHAIRGRDLLRSNGYRAFIEKTPGKLDRAGCSYSITMQTEPDQAVALLTANGIKVLGTGKQ